MDCSLPGFSVHGFSRQAYWSRLPFPSPGDPSNPRIEPRSPALQTDSLPSEPQWPSRDPKCWLQLPLPNLAAFTPWCQPPVITGWPCSLVSPPKFRTVSKVPLPFPLSLADDSSVRFHHDACASPPIYPVSLPFACCESQAMRKRLSSFSTTGIFLTSYSDSLCPTAYSEPLWFSRITDLFVEVKEVLKTHFKLFSPWFQGLP